jgi:hypothetical protein
MSTIWSVQTIFGNVNNTSEPSKSSSKLFNDQKEALAEYGERIKVGLPPDATSAMIYLWRAHNVVKHAHFWKDQAGTHCNEFSGAVQV